MQEIARALDQKHSLEEKINELNSKTTNKNSKKMKYEVFASQLEAHVGQSPVRGSKDIKTDRKLPTTTNSYPV